MNQAMYDLWVEGWQAEHPHQKPPTIEQLNSMMEMFNFTAAQLFGLEEVPRHSEPWEDAQ